MSHKFAIVVAVLLLFRQAEAAILYVEDFTADVGVTDRDGIMTVAHDGGNDWMTGSFPFQVFPTPQVDAFVVNSAQFVGDYVTPGLTQIRFDMFAVDVLPSDLFIRIIDGANVFSYQFNPIAGMLNNWQTFTVNLAWAFGWSGPSEVAFQAALASVDQIEIQISRSTGAAQEYRLDNIQTLDTDIGAGGGDPSMVPEPNTISLLVFSAALALVMRRHFLSRREIQA